MSSRLTVAAHILGMIAFIERERHRSATSEEIAESIGTNAVVVRRALSKLQSAGLVCSRRGVGGGTVLARHPTKITLRQAYEAVVDTDARLLGRHASEVSESCRVAPIIAEYLDELYSEAEEAMLARLAEVTIEAMSREIVDRLARRTSLRRSTTA